MAPFNPERTLQDELLNYEVEIGTHGAGVIAMKPTGQAYKELIDQLLLYRNIEVSPMLNFKTPEAQCGVDKLLLLSKIYRFPSNGVCEESPGAAFWNCHYDKYKSYFYYEALMQSVASGPFACYFLTCPMPNAWVRDQISLLKGSSTLVDANGQIVRKGTGLRGLATTQIITLNDLELPNSWIPDGYARDTPFPTLPQDLQRDLWSYLPPQKQMTLQSKVVHTPDSLQETAESLIQLLHPELATLDLSKSLTDDDALKLIYQTLEKGSCE